MVTALKKRPAPMAYLAELEAAHAQRECSQCGKLFSTVGAYNGNRKYCSLGCRKLRDQAAWEKRNPSTLKTSAAPGTVGTIGELVVSVDLLRRGLEVFRALSPHCSCDLAVIFKGALVRIEVRTGWVNTDGGLMSGANAKDPGRSDVLARVSRDGSRIEYTPDLFSEGK